MEGFKERIAIQYTEDGVPYFQLNSAAVSVLGREVVLTLGIGKEIQVFLKKQWDEMMERMSQIPEPRTSLFRYIVANSAVCDLSDGNLRIPQLLLDYAEIADEAFLVSENDTIILVSPAYVDTALAWIRNRKPFRPV